MIEDILPSRRSRGAAVPCIVRRAAARHVRSAAQVWYCKEHLRRGVANCGASAFRTSCQPARRLPARGPQQASQVILRRVTVPWRSRPIWAGSLGAGAAAGGLAGAGSAGAVRSRHGAAGAVHTGADVGVGAPAGADHASYPADGWSMPILVRMLTLYAGGSSLARVTRTGSIWRGFAAGSAAALAAWERRWRGWRMARIWRCAIRRGSGAARAALVCAQRGADVCADAAGARAGSDAEHLRPGGVGDPAGSADRAKRRGVRGDGGGAPAGIPGIESMVGLFISTLPLRVRLAAEQPLLALLHEVQERQSRLMAHQHLGLTDIRSTRIGDMFDTVVVFENYPMARGGRRCGRGAAERRQRIRRLSLSAAMRPARSAAAAATGVSRRPIDC